MMESTQPTQPEQQPKMLQVMYFPNITVYGSVRAFFEWTNDGRVKFSKVEGTPEKPVYTEIFNVSAGEIQKVSSMIDQIKLYVNGKVYRVSVAQYSSPLIGVAPGIGIAASHSMYKNSNADEWLAALKQSGVQVKRIGYGKFIAIALGITVVFIIPFIIGAMIYG